MPDIKIKPQMENPKVLEVSRAPKDAGSILKEQYETQQTQRRPADRGPVQYATDKAETAARRGTVLAADNVRRGAKRHKKAASERTTQHQEQTAQGSKTRAFSKCARDRALQAALEPLQPPAVRERGRLKAFEGREAHTKTRNLTEKENAALRALKGTAQDSAQASARIKQKKVNVKTGSAAVRGATAKDRLMTPVAVAAKKAKQEAQKKMQKQMLKQAAAKAKKTAQETGKAAVRIAKAAARAIVVAGSCAILLLVILLVAIIAAIVASPFGIFFSDENAGPDAVPVSAAVAEINSDFSARLEALQSDEYDDVVIHGAAAGWRSVLAVFASKVAGADGSGATDVVTFDRARIDKLKAVFWDMTAISSHVEEIAHVDSDPDDKVDDSWTEYILHITITAKTAAEMPAFYDFTPRQTLFMEELLLQRDILIKLTGGPAHD